MLTFYFVVCTLDAGKSNPSQDGVSSFKIN